MTTWEYMILKLQNVLQLGGQIETADPAQSLHRMLGGLNALGSDGWELTAMNVTIDMFVFKREKTDESAGPVGDGSSGALQGGEIPDQAG
jgi:hypothetical protein